MARAAERVAEGCGVWTPNNKEMQDTLARIGMDTKLRALEKNALLPEEQTRVVKIAQEIAGIQRQLRDRDRKVSRQRVSKVLSAVPLVAFSGKNVYVASSVLNICPTLRKGGARIICETDNCTHIVTAEIFVESQVAKPSDITAAASALIGGTVVNVREFQDGVGSVEALDKAISTDDLFV